MIQSEHRTISFMTAVGCLSVAVSGGLLAANSNVPTNSHDWLQWRGPHGNGISEETDWQSTFPASGPNILWRRQIGAGYASVSVSKGKLYTAGWKDGRDIIYCLDAKTGDAIWSRPYANKLHDRNHKGGPAGTPAIDGDRLYFINRSADLVCLDTNKGKQLWVKLLQQEYKVTEPQWAFSGSPIVQGNVVYLDIGRIIALNKINGEELWSTSDYGAAYSTPTLFTLNNHSLLAGFPEFGLVIIDAASGQELATHRWKTRHGVNAVTPIVQGDRLFVSTGYETGCAVLQLSNRGLDVVWENREMHNKMSTCVLVEGHLYGFDESTLKCIDFRTGEERWSQRGLGMGALMAADGKLIVISGEGDLVIADASPHAYHQRARAKVIDGHDCWIVPVLAGGKIYCRSGGGQLVCIDVQRQ